MMVCQLQSINIGTNYLTVSHSNTANLPTMRKIDKNWKYRGGVHFTISIIREEEEKFQDNIFEDKQTAILHQIYSSITLCSYNEWYNEWIFPEITVIVNVKNPGKEMYHTPNHLNSKIYQSYYTSIWRYRLFNGLTVKIILVELELDFLYRVISYSNWKIIQRLYINCWIFSTMLQKINFEEIFIQ